MGTFPCWICGGASTRTGEGISSHSLTSAQFAITDAAYSTTLARYRCDACGFEFCPEVADILPFYRNLADEDYERTRSARACQARALLNRLTPYVRRGTLMDVGAASGILVEQANLRGYAAEGCDVSAWLVERATARGLDVSLGTLAELPFRRWDAIILADVIEHVNTPVPLLRDIAQRLAKEGAVLIVTPDAKSFAARALGRKWWHRRIAHIGYFDKETLSSALRRAQLEPVAWHRPSWVLPLNYLIARVAHYIPWVGFLARIRFLEKIPIRFNLRDSWLVIARHQGTS